MKCLAQIAINLSQLPIVIPCSIVSCPRDILQCCKHPWVVFAQEKVYNTAPALSRGGSRDGYKFRKTQRTENSFLIVIVIVTQM